MAAWLERHGPQAPSNVQLGLVCVRGGIVDCKATSELHGTAYAILGERMRSLSLHLQRLELCDAAG